MRKNQTYFGVKPLPAASTDWIATVDRNKATKKGKENEMKDAVKKAMLASIREREREIESEIKLMAERGLSLIALYCSTSTPSVRAVSTNSDERTYSDDRTLSRRHLLRISHFNR